MLSFAWLLVTALTCSRVSAAPVASSNGINYVGFENNKSQYVWRSIPYAAPPVGERRFQPPQPVNLEDGTTLDNTEFASICHQVNSELDGQSEDCLYLDIMAPSDTDPSSSLPVIFFIYGGSFIFGSTPSYQSWTSSLAEQSVLFDQPIITVVANYRTGPWGWLVGQEAQDQGLANAGLQDQRAVLHWIQENIYAFGGDPERVTLAGQSAGAVSASLHLLVNNGDHEGLFQSAFLQSGTANTLGIGGPELRQPVFDALVDEAGCFDAADKIDCLRSIDEADFDAAVYNSTKSLDLSYTWAPQLDGIILTERPSLMFSEGRFADVPIVTGDTLDEGTSKHTPYISSQAEVASWVQRVNPPGGVDLDTIYELMAITPNDPGQGSPYQTGGETFETGPLGKKAASLIGDMQFNAPRRHFLEQAESLGRTVYNYIYEQSSNTARGAYHAIDLGMWPARSSNSLSQEMSRYFVNFINTGDPNGNLETDWPTYGASANALSLLEGNITVIPDTAREEQIRFIIEHAEDFHH